MIYSGEFPKLLLRITFCSVLGGHRVDEGRPERATAIVWAEPPEYKLLLFNRC